MAQPTHPTMLPPALPGGDRDELIDLLRSLATTTVVLWHWVLTILVWRADGPHTDNPIGYVSGLWSLTWVLQVMPLFLWHSVGFALFYGLVRAAAAVPEEPNLNWWVTRPLWVIGPALLTLPFLAATRRLRPAA